MSVESSGFQDPASKERAETVLRQAFASAQIGMPSEDRETAVESLRIILEALLVDHLAPDAEVLEDRAERHAPLGAHWRRMVTSAVTNTFVLGGVFVMPEEMLQASEQRADQYLAGTLWHTRRPPGPGALVLAVHTALAQLEATAGRGQFAGADDAVALVDIIALATVGAALAGEPSAAVLATAEGRAGTQPGSGRWTRDGSAAAAAFGIPAVALVPVERAGWACDTCGCLFAGRVEAGVAYPDRFAPVGRGGPCDSTSDCDCHQAPLQREVR